MQICDHVNSLQGDAGLFSTLDVISNHEWYHRLFKLLSHFRGACYRISGDYLFWGMGAKVRKVSDEIMRIAKLCGVPCWDDSTLWWRLERYKIW